MNFDMVPMDPHGRMWSQPFVHAWGTDGTGGSGELLNQDIFTINEDLCQIVGPNWWHIGDLWRYIWMLVYMDVGIYYQRSTGNESCLD